MYKSHRCALILPQEYTGVKKTTQKKCSPHVDYELSQIQLRGAFTFDTGFCWYVCQRKSCDFGKVILTQGENMVVWALLNSTYPRIMFMRAYSVRLVFGI